MALTLKTIVRLYLLFFVFQICVNLFIVIMPLYDENISAEHQQYLNFLNNQVNGVFDSEEMGNSLLDNFRDSMETRDLFNEGIINAFLGVLKVIGSVIWFIVQLALNILFTPGVLVQILLYNFIVSSTYTFFLSIIVNVSFYSTMFYIVFKRRISQT